MGIDVVVLARFLLTGIALLLAFLAAVTWNRRKDAPEAAIFAVLVASMAVYVFGYAGEIAQTTVEGARFWLHIEYLALPWAGALWVLAACRHMALRVRPPLLFVVPVITFVGHYTNFRNLFYTAPMTVVHRGPFWVLVVYRGPLSVLDNAFLFVAFLCGTWIYLSALRHASSLFRKQAVVLVLSSFLPFVGYFAYLAGLSPWGLDITPITLGVTCMLLYYGMFHCGMFDLAPLARHLIFNSMRDAVLILDTQDRLLDFNPAAQAMLPELSTKRLGGGVLDLFVSTPGLAAALGRAEGSRATGIRTEGLNEIQVGVETEALAYEVRYWPLLSGTRPVGRAVIFADVSAEVQLREELRLRADTDSLTGLANRRVFQKALEMECMRYSRNSVPMSLMMIDLDYFKDVNDQFGHPVGDVVLRTVAERLHSSLRKTDVLARFGGEEFSVLLPETRAEGAKVIAERVRLAINRLPIVVEDIPIPITISIGVTSHSSDREAIPDILLKQADLALYRAKTAGRNRVESL